MEHSLTWAIARPGAGDRRAAHRHVLPADARHRRFRRGARRLAGLSISARRRSSPSSSPASAATACTSIAPKNATQQMAPIDAGMPASFESWVDAGRAPGARALPRRAAGMRSVEGAATLPSRAATCLRARRRWQHAQGQRQPHSRAATALRGSPHVLETDHRRGRSPSSRRSCPALSEYWVWVLVIGVVIAFVIEGVRIVPQQSAWVVERLGKLPRHARARPEPDHPVLRPRRLPALAEGSAARRARAGLHHQGQHPARGRRHPLLPGDRPAARLLRLVELHRGDHRSSRRPRCAA